MTRRARAILSRATSPFIPAFPLSAKFNADGDDKGGGGGADKGKADDKSAKDQPKKIELTEDELTQRIAAATEAALNKERETAAQKAQREKEEAEREKAEKDGEYQKLAEADRKRAEAAERDRDEARLTAKRADVNIQLRDYLAEKHAEYVGVAKYIMPLVEFDLKTDAKELEKRISAAADQYVKDNPRKPAGGSPGAPGRNQHMAKSGGTVQQRISTDRNNSVARSRF